MSQGTPLTSVLSKLAENPRAHCGVSANMLHGPQLTSHKILPLSLQGPDS